MSAWSVLDLSGSFLARFWLVSGSILGLAGSGLGLAGSGWVWLGVAGSGWAQACLTLVLGSCLACFCVGGNDLGSFLIPSRLKMSPLSRECSHKGGNVPLSRECSLKGGFLPVFVPPSVFQVRLPNLCSEMGSP